MKLDYDDFECRVSNYFVNKGWTTSNCQGDCILEKRYNNLFPNRSSKKNLRNDDFLYEKINMIFKETLFKKKKSLLLKNDKGNSDFVFAGYQIVSQELNISGLIKKDSWFLFQPVVRLNNYINSGVDEGYLTSFVNICLIDLNTSLDEYLDHIDWWISVFSSLSLHVTGFRLRLKKRTRAFEGLGIEFLYKGIELGQANIYCVENDSGSYYLSDFGFGYERLLWAINCGKNFFLPIFESYDVVMGKGYLCDKMRTAILLLSSGILPSANGVGRHVMQLIISSNELNNDRFVKIRIKNFYDYYARFLSPVRTLEQVTRSYINVVNSNEYRNYFGSLKKPADNISDKLFLELFRERYLISKGIKNN